MDVNGRECGVDRLGSLWVCLVWLSLGVFPARGLTIEGDSAATNDRFANADEFIAGEFNLSGLAAAPGGRWVTLISPNVYVASEHFKPALGAVVTFYAGNDPTGRKVNREVSSTRIRIGNSDLSVGVFDSPLPEDYVYYERATESLPAGPLAGLLSNQYPYLGENLYHFGKSQRLYTSSQRLAVGRNRLSSIESLVQVSEPSAMGPAIVADRDDMGSPEFVAYETFTESGDSGGALMSDRGDGTLRLVGVAWYRTVAPDRTGFTPLGSYRDEIDDFVASHGRGYLPNSPGELEVTALSSSELILAWQDRSEIESGYRVERQDLAGEWELIAELAANTEQFADSGLEAGGSYRYRVAAVGTEGLSAWSAEEVAQTLTAYEEWVIGQGFVMPFTPDLLENGDFDQDGVANLLEFAFGGSLQQMNSAQLPQLVQSEMGVEVKFLRAREELVYRLLISEDLKNWTEWVVDPGLVGELIELSLPTSGAQFLQVKINF